MDVVGLLQIVLQQNRVFQYGEDSYSVMGITFCPCLRWIIPRSEKGSEQ